MQKSNRLTLYIILSMIAGIVLGYVIHLQAGPEFIASFSKNIKLLTTIFLRLVQMIIAPLVFLRWWLVLPNWVIYSLLEGWAARPCYGLYRPLLPPYCWECYW